MMHVDESERIPRGGTMTGTNVDKGAHAVGDVATSVPAAVGSFEHYAITAKKRQRSTASRSYRGAVNEPSKERTLKISARYDTSIVHALDEILCRGPFAVFLDWLLDYAATVDLPGCFIVVGYAPDTMMRGAVCRGAAELPYVRIDPYDEFPVFALKRDTNYPAIVLLYSLQNSKLSRTLSCDGCVTLSTRESMKRNCRNVSEILGDLSTRYLDNMYDFAPRGSRVRDERNNEDDEPSEEETAMIDYEDTDGGDDGRQEEIALRLANHGNNTRKTETNKKQKQQKNQIYNDDEEEEEEEEEEEDDEREIRGGGATEKEEEEDEGKRSGPRSLSSSASGNNASVEYSTTLRNIAIMRSLTDVDKELRKSSSKCPPIVPISR